MNETWLNKIISTPELLEMGHGQTKIDSNLGMGWIYYSLSRLYRPKCVVCIGSWRGFVPMMFSKGMVDNLSNGKVHFIDPSFVDNHWQDSLKVNNWFKNYDLENIEHYKQTTQEFTRTNTYRNLDNIDILFVDGLHTKEQAKFDFESFVHKLSQNSICLFHDSISDFESDIYGENKTYKYSVHEFMKELKSDNRYQVFDFPFEFGLSLVRKS